MLRRKGSWVRGPLRDSGVLHVRLASRHPFSSVFPPFYFPPSLLPELPPPGVLFPWGFWLQWALSTPRLADARGGHQGPLTSLGGSRG